MSALWLGGDPLLLASGSATRRQLLEAAGLPVQVHPAAIDERAVERPLVEAGRPPGEIALALARAKAQAVAAARPGRVVLGADQILSLDGRQFHKPRGVAEARAQLLALAGRTHRLHAAAVLMREEAVLFQAVDAAGMTMRPLSEEFVARYLALVGDTAGDSVGGYKLEGLGIHLFARVEGDHASVLGLPMMPLLAGLRSLGLLAG